MRNTTYHGISCDMSDGRPPTVLLVDNWNDTQQRAEINSDRIVGVEADWDFSFNPGNSCYRLDIWVDWREYPFEVVVPKLDDCGVWFADVLDNLSAILHRNIRK